MSRPSLTSMTGEPSTTLFLAGDVMIGRGVDQILVHPSAPELHEPFVTDAREYLRLAEQVSGPMPRGVAPDCIWGDALAEWKRMAPAARIVNLETSITRCGEYERKGINYRCLVLMFFPSLSQQTGQLLALEMTHAPNLRLNRASVADMFSAARA